MAAGSIGLEPRIWIEVSDGAKGIVLRGSDARHQTLVTAIDAQGGSRDVTRDVSFAIDPPWLASIDATGLLQPLQNGQGVLHAKTADGHVSTIPLEVQQWHDEPTVNFPNQVIPIFTKLGCNGGGCHGKAAGQNGFKLSLLGFEPREDYEHLVKESKGRRVSAVDPDESLILTKAINAIPHGGGQRMEKDSYEYRVLRRWISQGMPVGNPDDAKVVSILIAPDQRRLVPGSHQQLAVTAKYSNGTEQDVTRAVQFESNDTDMADVDKTGLVSIKQLAGDVAIMARYQGQVAVFRASVPILDGENHWPLATSPIDEAVIGQLRSLNIPMSQPCDDATFLRRVTLDIAGRLPTLRESTQFAADTSENKRQAKVDVLLASDDYADYFANKWMLILRNRRERESQQSGTFGFHRWIRQQMADNRPYDAFVRDIVAASGSIDLHPPVAWYRQVSDNSSRLEDASQLFLGQRIQCARCHHHPMEKWSQKDYFQMAAFFSLVRTKPGSAQDEPIVYVGLGQPRAAHPKTGEQLKPAGLDGPSIEDADDSDPRQRLVDWMTARDNPFFARSLVNRYWKHFMGRGLVEPEDDMRATNPPSNPVLLDTLAQQFVQSNYDLKSLVRAICNSQTYQLASQPNGANIRDRKCYSRFYPRRLQAEVILDAIDQASDSITSFDVVPERTRAIALPDTSFRSYFLTVFGRPEGTTACECERSNESTLAQSLHFVNSKELLTKLSAGTALPANDANDLHRDEGDKIAEMYLRTLSRPVTESEMSASIHYLRSAPNAAQGYEDLLWSLLNCKEFLFNH